MKSKDIITADFPPSRKKHILPRFYPIKPRFLPFLKMVVCLLLLSLSILSFPLKNRFESVIHIYSDEATIPALLQMIDMIHQPANEPKLLIWNRFRNIDSYTTLLPFSAQPIKWNISFEEQIQTFVNSYPTHRIVFHYNIAHEERLNTFLNIIPPERIKAIHAYEDAAGWLWWNRSRDKRIQDNPPYPVIYHVLKASLFSQPACTTMPYCHQLQTLFKGKIVQEIDFKKLAKKLTKNEKEKLYQLLNLDIKTLESLFSKHPTLLFISSLNWESSQMDINQIYLFKEICAQNIKSQTHEKPYTWLLKSHPSYLLGETTFQYLRKNCPGLVEIPAYLPFEILILAGLTPDKTAGYSSSLFFNLDSDDILFYLPRINNPYLPILKELKKINEQQIISLDKIQSDIKTDIVSLFIKHSHWEDHLIFITPTKVCRLFLKNECASVLNQTPQEITIKWEHWKKETFYHLNNNVWTLFPTNN